MKYRLLTSEERQIFDEDFKYFLISNGVKNEEWEEMNKSAPDKALKLVELFSDSVLDIVYKKVQFIEFRSTDSCMVFNCLDEHMEVISILPKPNAKVDLSTPERIHETLSKTADKLSIFKAQKQYSKSREEEIHQLTEQGCVNSQQRFLGSTRAINRTTMIQIQNAFPNQKITLVQKEKGGVELVMVDFPEKRVQLLMTYGLSKTVMPVHEKYKGRERVELYFCLPSYWDINTENEKYIWPQEWLHKLSAHVITKKLWFGPGHTIEAQMTEDSLSSTMKQDHLILSNPILMEKELSDISLNGEKVHFLCCIPIFGDEMDYKQAKGTYKLMKKLNGKGISEKLDDFRATVLKSRFKPY